MYELRFGALPRVVDAVVWPESHEQVVKLVELAMKHDVVLIPFGGGTSVSCAVQPPQHEKRCIVSVSLRAMNRILRVDKANMVWFISDVGFVKV